VRVAAALCLLIVLAGCGSDEAGPTDKDSGPTLAALKSQLKEGMSLGQVDALFRPHFSNRYGPAGGASGSSIGVYIWHLKQGTVTLLFRPVSLSSEATWSNARLLRGADFDPGATDDHEDAGMVPTRGARSR
jgi:hypothetical protein